MWKCLVPGVIGSLNCQWKELLHFEHEALRQGEGLDYAVVGHTSTRNSVFDLLVEGCRRLPQDERQERLEVLLEFEA